MKTTSNQHELRSALSSLRLQYDPSIKPIREQIVEGIVKNAIYLSSDKNGASIREIQHEVVSGCLLNTDVGVIVRKSLSQLEADSAISRQGTGQHTRFRLTSDQREKIGSFRRSAQDQNDEIA
ncbi:MAG: hypothetical protein HQ477_03685 [Chloroflexi bacterium]|nr:hypothetical protein [Chloroflexota bacterium]